MKNKYYRILILLLLSSSCTQKIQQNKVQEYQTAKFIEIERSMVVPNYIGTSINCINLASQEEWNERNPKVVINYFSEYSSIYFFITITERQIYFETYNDTGTPKPNLIFYSQSINENIKSEIIDFFSRNETFQELEKLSSSDDKTLALKDHIKQGFENKFGADKFPLTRKEAKWLIERSLNLIKQITNKEVKFNEELIAPVFYNMCNYDEEFKQWQMKYPEINEHKLNY